MCWTPWITTGAAVGFLPHNFYPARIIMGDTGSMLLGQLLAAATIVQVGHTTQSLGPNGHDIAAFSLPVLVPFQEMEIISAAELANMEF